MRKISEMYWLSGGTCASHRCEECCNFQIKVNKGKKYFKCLLYSMSSCESSDWRKSYPACAWFNQYRKESNIIHLNAHQHKPETNIDGQLTLEDCFKGT